MPNVTNYFITNIGSQDSTISLTSPIKMPNSTGFLWNKQMMIQANCRGYVNAQFMQPEPSKYSRSPNIEATSFIQPEHKYFTHHPGRFFYIKDNESGEFFSAPYEPTRRKLDKFIFELSHSKISWQVECLGIRVDLCLSLTEQDAVERWSISVTNLSTKNRSLSIYPYFSIGYMSWMNQSATFESSLNAIVASSVTPYQKVEDYFKNKSLKDKTFLAADCTPIAWNANQNDFEGEGGLHCPDALSTASLKNTDARYDTPVAVMQFDRELNTQQQTKLNFLFGPAKDQQEIKALTDRYLPPEKQQEVQQAYDTYLAQSKGCLTISTKDKNFDDFVNHWLPRQMFYHGDVNRLSTDPQTRNYLQDGMGMCYINSSVTRQTLLTAIAQQQSNGAMPDGVLLHPEAELKYINQIPHADHCVWLPICLIAYLNETGDYALLTEQRTFSDSTVHISVSGHVDRALEYLLQARDHRGLSYIEQGDWCDPMNMVGYQGKGVSSWLSLATSYALQSWCDLLESQPDLASNSQIDKYRCAAKDINESVNDYLWDGDWFARGITDKNNVFGGKADSEGRIFLNPQSWAILAGAANVHQKRTMHQQINQQLMTPFGVMMLAPSYTQMREDIGRITQKHPGVAENGSVYNHASVFYAYSLFQEGYADKAFDVLKCMLPTTQTSNDVGQLPAFVPNYYRGAYHQFPAHAGRSSQLFNTGTVAWFYRCIVEELCGLKGCATGLKIDPKLPEHMLSISGQRIFRKAIFDFTIDQCANRNEIEIMLNGEKVAGRIISDIKAEQRYQLKIFMPKMGL